MIASIVAKLLGSAGFSFLDHLLSRIERNAGSRYTSMLRAKRHWPASSRPGWSFPCSGSRGPLPRSRPARWEGSEGNNRPTGERFPT